MKVLFFVILASLLFCEGRANAQPLSESCSGRWCQCYREGNCGHVRGPASCIITIEAPTLSGKVTLDVRNERRESVFPDGPRIKKARGSVKFRIGCHWLEGAGEVYMCVDSPEGQYSSVRLASDGHIAQALQTKHLSLCLLGPDCPGYLGRPRSTQEE